MRGHHLCLFERAVVQEIRRNARGAEGIAADRGEDTRLQRPPLHHAVGVNAVQASVGETDEKEDAMRGNSAISHSMGSSR